MSCTREFACNSHRADKENPLAVRRSAIMSTPPNFKLIHYRKLHAVRNGTGWRRCYGAGLMIRAPASLPGSAIAATSPTTSTRPPATRRRQWG